MNNLDDFYLLTSITDTAPPSFGNTCPNSTTVILAKGESFAYVNWRIPTAIDNSGERPVVTATPNIYPPLKQSVGVTAIAYQARDKEGNSKVCEFTIEVKGRMILMSLTHCNI